MWAALNGLQTRHGRARPGHPRLGDVVKAWMPGARPGITEETTARVTSRAPGSQNIAYSCACRHIATEDALAGLLALNLERASVQT
jgi:hypothetical protein